MPQPAVRPLAAADLPAVVRIEKSTFPDPWSLTAFKETLARPEVRGLALDDEKGRFVGYGICVIAADEGEILNLAVESGHRRQGAGRQLVEAMLRQLRSAGAARVYLEVRPSNLAAIGLYRAVGFQPLGSRPAYYAQPREDAVTMVLDVTQNTA